MPGSQGQSAGRLFGKQITLCELLQRIGHCLPSQKAVTNYQTYHLPRITWPVNKSCGWLLCAEGDAQLTLTWISPLVIGCCEMCDWLPTCSQHCFQLTQNAVMREVLTHDYWTNRQVWMFGLTSCVVWYLLQSEFRKFWALQAMGVTSFICVLSRFTACRLYVSVVIFCYIYVEKTVISTWLAMIYGKKDHYYQVCHPLRWSCSFLIIPFHSCLSYAIPPCVSVL